jgi:uncharacterized protein YfaP (DUF2135 family)
LLARLGPEGKTRARALEARVDPVEPAFEAVLFWNIDDTDVDLHVLERDGGVVSYKRFTSATGGKLHWDNRTGLGPEVYTHASAEPLEAFVHYFGTRSVAGTVPAATLLLTARAGDSWSASCAVLPDKQAQSVVWRAGERSKENP